MGVFLGTYDGHQLGKDDDRMYACFADLAQNLIILLRDYLGLLLP